MNVVNVTSKDDYLKQKNLCKTKSSGIVVLDPLFAVGANLRFKLDAEVLVLQFKNVVKEDIDQKMARGSRTLGSQKGILFTKG